MPYTSTVNNLATTVSYYPLPSSGVGPRQRRRADPDDELQGILEGNLVAPVER